MITKLENYHTFTAGAFPLPAGAIPLAGGPGGSLVCFMPSGRWVNFQAAVIKTMPPETQKEVMKLIVSQLGGNAAKAAEALGFAHGRIQNLQSGHAAMTVKTAWAIAERLSG